MGSCGPFAFPVRDLGQPHDVGLTRETSRFKLSGELTHDVELPRGRGRGQRAGEGSESP